MKKCKTGKLYNCCNNIKTIQVIIKSAGYIPEIKQLNKLMNGC